MENKSKRYSSFDELFSDFTSDEENYLAHIYIKDILYIWDKKNKIVYTDSSLDPIYLKEKDPNGYEKKLLNQRNLRSYLKNITKKESIIVC